jgi:hypothetical protein
MLVNKQGVAIALTQDLVHSNVVHNPWTRAIRELFFSKPQYNSPHVFLTVYDALNVTTLYRPKLPESLDCEYVNYANRGIMLLLEELAQCNRRIVDNEKFASSRIIMIADAPSLTRLGGPDLLAVAAREMGVPIVELLLSELNASTNERATATSNYIKLVRDTLGDALLDTLLSGRFHHDRYNINLLSTDIASTVSMRAKDTALDYMFSFPRCENKLTAFTLIVNTFIAIASARIHRNVAFVGLNCY